MSSKEHIHCHLTFLFTFWLRHAINMKHPTKNEKTNHDDDRKLPAIPVREEEDDKALSRATTLTQSSVTGEIPPTITTDVEIATNVPVVCRATISLGLIFTAGDGCRVDDDTVDRILDKTEDENDDSYICLMFTTHQNSIRMMTKNVLHPL
jgi:hypothetical protein